MDRSQEYRFLFIVSIVGQGIYIFLFFFVSLFSDRGRHTELSKSIPICLGLSKIRNSLETDRYENKWQVVRIQLLVLRRVYSCEGTHGAWPGPDFDH